MVRGGLGSGVEHAVDDVVEHLGLDRAQQQLHLAGGAHHRSGGLTGDIEAVEHIARVVADLRERERVLVDETLERVVAARPGDADELGLAGPPLCCLLDRGGFSITRASTRCPKPKSHWAFGKSFSQRETRLRSNDVCGNIIERCYFSDR